MHKQKSIKPVSSVSNFNDRLLESKQEYLLESDVPASRVYLKFTGMFHGEPVVWNACIRTIDEYSQHHEVAKDPLQFIEIDVDNGVHFLQVGLNVEVIDKPTIERTILMIRRYRRLYQGRHEYGARSKTE